MLHVNVSYFIKKLICVNKNVLNSQLPPVFYMPIRLVLLDFIMLVIYYDEYYRGVELRHRFVRCG